MFEGIKMVGLEGFCVWSISPIQGSNVVIWRLTGGVNNFPKDKIGEEKFFQQTNERITATKKNKEEEHVMFV